MIRELDAEFLGLRAPKTAIEEVPITDAAGIRALLQRLAKKPKPQFDGQAAGLPGRPFTG